ncbi:MAG: toll/interleukin-1 receptor domain-containing protein, partial [bacterium]|nr:toll/interleukin-1 receptor domain-containing protein [bacterium]
MTADKGSGPAIKDFFISYNRADREWAEWLAWILEAGGYSAVIEAWDFRPGGNFALEMHQAARNTRYTAMVLSQDYLDAVYTDPEWAAAFAKDPQGRQRKLIPFRVAECEPDGLLSSIIYVDLVGVEKKDAKAAVLAVLKDRLKPDQEPDFPGSSDPGDEPAAVKVEISRLPVTGEHFVGRVDHLARLDAAWDDAGVHVLSLVAWGGVGKSALVNR